MKRYPTDLSHFGFNCGDIGSLQTLSCIPIMANDGVSFNLEGVFRLSPLRRNIVVDCAIDMFAFFVPHRHIYGQSWIDFIKDGVNETETFTGIVADGRTSYLGSEITTGQTYPLWLGAGYNRIWNRYFRAPTDGNTRADNYKTANNTELVGGFKCGPLPVAWSTGTLAGVDSSEREVDTTGDDFDIADLERVKRSYASIVDREYFGQRYNDILKTAFGSTVNTDADERPTLCAHKRWWLSGYDVDGTGDANLGNYVGKAAGIGTFGFPRKFFSEHGALWIMCLPRFPTIHVNERPRLCHIVNPSYLQIAGDPDVISAEPPETIYADEYFFSAAHNDLGEGPYGQHYRYHPSTVHRLYEEVDGFSFIDTQIGTFDEAHYIATDEYSEVFQTDPLRQWQSQVHFDVQVMRLVPPARGSLYAGA